MGQVPVPAGWVEGARQPGRAASVLRDRSDPESARLVAHTDFAVSTSLGGWRDLVVEGLARSVEDWLLIDVGPARIAGTRGFRVLGCSSPPGRPARVHETWCAVRDRHRCSVTLTAAVRDYDDIIDSVASAIGEWAPPVAGVD